MIGGVTTSVSRVGGSAGAGVLGGGTAAFFSVISENHSVIGVIGGSAERAVEAHVRRKLDVMELLQSLNEWQNRHGSMQIAKKAASDVCPAVLRHLTIYGSTESCGASRTGEWGAGGQTKTSELISAGGKPGGLQAARQYRKEGGSPTLRVTRLIGEACAAARACISDRTRVPPGSACCLLQVVNLRRVQG